MEHDDNHIQNENEEQIRDNSSTNEANGDNIEHNYREYQKSYQDKTPEDYNNTGGCVNALFTGFGIFAVVVFLMFGACFMAWR